MLSATYARLENRAKALEFANIALAGKPVLPNDRRNDVKRLKAWAQTKPQATGDTEVSGKADGSDSKPRPTKSKPPRIKPKSKSPKF
jgi:hypothetical protein